MNERDLEMVARLDAFLGAEAIQAPLLVSAHHTQVARLNLILLKVLLDLRRLRGIFITIDRPHQYMTHLMRLHGVSQENLLYLDAISSHSADTKTGTAVAGMLNGPFQIERLPSMLCGDGSAPGGLPIDWSRVDFMLLDNLGTLLMYNTQKSVEEFTANFLAVLEVPRRRFTAFIVDASQRPDLYRLLEPRCPRTLAISQSFSVLDEGPRLQPTPMGPAGMGR